MTISPSSFEEYYARYAPRTHGLPTPIPLHEFPRGREFYRKLGEPKKIVAPMVDQSELVHALQVNANFRRGEFLRDVMERSYVIHQ